MNKCHKRDHKDIMRLRDMIYELQKLNLKLAEGCACGATFEHGPHEGPAVPLEEKQ